VEAMRSRGFTDHEFDLMFKDNPARLLELSGK
jgi:predicted metal-dependent phosphotriesterase family hydrolase